MSSTTDSAIIVEALSNANSEANVSNNSCEMCSNYETNLTRMQKVEQDLLEQLVASKELANRYEKELSGERLYRKDLEARLTDFGLNIDAKVVSYSNMEETFKERINILIQKQENDMKDMLSAFKMVSNKVVELEQLLRIQQKRYETLLCLNKTKAAEMREQDIELPQTVDQLQFFALQLREELIETKAAYEHSENEHRDELAMAREQLLELEIRLRENDDLLEQQQEQLFQQEKFQQFPPEIMIPEISGKNRKSNNLSTQQNSPTHIVGGVNSIKASDLLRYREIIADLERQISESQKDRAKIERALNESRQKCLTIQKELNISEQVQKDFVRLSQNLQIQLEKIRQSETEVRWQFDEDIIKCNHCANQFDNKIPKLHCSHCGRVFCRECLMNTIPSGPNHRPARVCDVCYTLLNRESIPFFSVTEAQKQQETETNEN